MADDDERWWDAERTAKFLDSLSPVQTARVETLRNETTVSYRTAYRRTRNGKAVWEVRADDISGCLRTARGGSSRQAIIRMGNGQAAVRWMTPREYAALMGAAPLQHYGPAPQSSDVRIRRRCFRPCRGMARQALLHACSEQHPWQRPVRGANSALESHCISEANNGSDSHR